MERILWTGYISVYFLDDNDNIVKEYTTHIPDGGINPGERNTLVYRSVSCVTRQLKVGDQHI